MPKQLKRGTHIKEELNLYATSATAKTCGLSSPNAAPLYCSIM